MGSRGQVTLELVVSTTVIAILLSCAGFILKAEWDRGKCAYLSFEATHAAMSEDPGTPETPEVNDQPQIGSGGLKPLSEKLARRRPVSSQVQVSRSDSGVNGVGGCGDAKEGVSFKFLESISW
jgi:hypothetical protein